MKKTFMTIVLMAFAFAMQAQTKFHDVEANEATGPVKSITNTVMGRSQTVTFTPEGKMQLEGLSNQVYDNDGYLQSYTISANGNQVNVTLTWENGRVKSQSMAVMGQTVTTSPIYDENGKVTGQTVDMAGQKMTTNFTDIKYDERGNFISRKTSMMGQVIEMPRTIEYYE